eukprot:243549_1
MLEPTAIGEGNVQYNRVDDNISEDSDDSIESPSLLFIHGALILAQILFGGGAVVGELGLPDTNPVLFAFIRECIAGPILLLIAYGKNQIIPSLSDWKLFIPTGICLFLNQLCFIVGLKISSGITASAWQPSQGVLAVMYGFCFGLEPRIDIYKTFGIIIGTAGALFMILYDNHDSSGNRDFFHVFGGSIMFFLNCSATVMYLILGKKALKKYPSSTITGYSYIIASFLMIFTQLIVGYGPSGLLNGICPDCNGAWTVPSATIIALVYWILAESVVSYSLITWANKHAAVSVNLAYTVLQPLTAVIGSEILLVSNVVPTCHKNNQHNSDNCLYGVSYNDLGAIGIVIGLYCVIYRTTAQRLAPLL